MPEIDITITISVIVTLVAIISPIFTSVINNIYQLKLKKLELKQNEYEKITLHKRELFENFLSAFNQVCHLQTYEAISQYSSCYSLVYIYLPQNVRKDLGMINLLISRKHWDEAIKYVDTISIDIYKEMQKLSL